MNTEQANRYLDGFQINDRSIYDSQDNEHPLDCVLEDYHQEQLKLFSIHVVSCCVCETPTPEKIYGLIKACITCKKAIAER
tara:strand:- start:167 stop:409 length:243 start_codon:yes stop_codon:yes gene_type:complete